MSKIKLELEIDISGIDIQTHLTEECVDSIQELEILYRSQARKDICEFVNCWEVPITCTSLKIIEDKTE